MDIVRSVKTLGYKGAFVAQKYAPEILTGLGIAGFGASTFLIAKSTLRLEPTLAVAEQRLEDAHLKAAEGGNQIVVVRAYLKNTGDIVKLYGAPVSLALASIASVLAAHGIMRRRSAALVAAYGVLETAFSNYRNRVREVIGEEREQDLYLGIVEETVTQKGKKTTVKRLPEEGYLSPYALLFDESNPYWENSAGVNKSLLVIKQQHFNDMLNVRGHLFLNEVHRGLGFPDTKPGQIVGWTTDGKGDGYVDLGIFEANSDVKVDFINGHERSIWLNPNVDGDILHVLS